MLKSNQGIVFLLLLFSLTGCQMYHSQFDCPPGYGVPCTPVTTIEKMIIETDEGPDLFLGYVPVEKQSSSCGFSRSSSSKAKESTRVWIEGKQLPCGTYIEGHYIFIPLEGN